MIRNNKITASLARYLFATLTGLAIVFSATAESLHLVDILLAVNDEDSYCG